MLPILFKKGGNYYESWKLAPAAERRVGNARTK